MNKISSFYLIRLKNVPIFEQLLLEEELLRYDTRNFCLLNEGSSRAIVMGISGNPQELINTTALEKSPCPIIKRFSGGGTVIVDEDTLFISWICQKESFPFLPYPEKILEWSESIYQPALKIQGFHLRENDFVIDHKKCGGNAQYITKDRFLQHTSFLWDYNPANMDYLLHPKKTPKYRAMRSHTDFLCSLKEHFHHKESCIEQFLSYLADQTTLIPVKAEELTIHPQPCMTPKRISTCYIESF